MTPRRFVLQGLLVVSAASDLAAAQEPRSDPIARALRNPATSRALTLVDRDTSRAAGTLVEIAAIPSPSGGERRRAEAVARIMREIGLTKVSVDSLANVVGTIPGRSDRALFVVTMLDDLPAIDSLRRSGVRIRRDGDRMLGPGTEIQSTVVAMLTAARALVAAGFAPEHDLVFAAVAREETGLEGMEALYHRTQARAVGYLEVLGDGAEIAYGAAGAVAWWKVVATGPAGHTMEGGLPNVNQAIARAVDAVLGLARHGGAEETAVNVGMIRSGEVFNHKPASGWFSIDLRARDRDTVEAMGRRIAAILGRVSAATGITLAMVPDFQSLGGQIAGAREAPFTQAAIATARYLGLEPEVTDRGCCNMRVAIAGGTPALGLHGSRGGGRGTRAEWASLPALTRMAKFVVLMAAALP